MSPVLTDIHAAPLVDRFVIERSMDIQPKALIPRELSARDVFKNPYVVYSV